MNTKRQGKGVESGGLNSNTGEGFPEEVRLEPTLQEVRESHVCTSRGRGFTLTTAS